MVYRTWFDHESAAPPSTARSLIGRLEEHPHKRACVGHSYVVPSECITLGLLEAGCEASTFAEGDLAEVGTRDGTLLGAARLSSGIEITSPSIGCEYRFSVAALPQAPLYVIRIGDFSWDFIVDDLDEAGWRVSVRADTYP